MNNETETMQLSCEQPKNTRWTFSAHTFLFWAMSCTTAYQSTYLYDLGYNSSQVGAILAVSFLFGMLSPPLFGMIADKTRAIKRMFLIAAMLQGISALLLRIALSATLFLIPLAIMIVPLYMAFLASGNSLLDGWLIKICNQSNGKIQYSMIRPWGSLGFAISNFFLTFIVGVWGSSSIYAFAAIMAVATLLWAMRRPQPKYEQVGEKIKVRVLSFFKNRYFTTFVIFAVLINLSLNTNISFAPWLVDAVGGSRSSVGVLTFIRVIFEAGTIATGRRLAHRFSLQKILIASGCVSILLDSLFAASTGMVGIAVCESFEGISYGLFLVAASQYIYELNPPECAASAQSVLVAATYCGKIISSILGGWLVASLGIRTTFLTTAGIQLCSSLVFLVFGTNIVFNRDKSKQRLA